MAPLWHWVPRAMVLNGVSCAVTGGVVGGEMVTCWKGNQGSWGQIQELQEAPAPFHPQWERQSTDPAEGTT